MGQSQTLFCLSWTKCSEQVKQANLIFTILTNFYKKTVGFSRIRTRVVSVEGEQTDQLTTATAHDYIKSDTLI